MFILVNDVKIWERISWKGTNLDSVWGGAEVAPGVYEEPAKVYEESAEVEKNIEDPEEMVVGCVVGDCSVFDVIELTELVVGNGDEVAGVDGKAGSST